jgi:ketosteroid isomerase-like protein
MGGSRNPRHAAGLSRARGVLGVHAYWTEDFEWFIELEEVIDAGDDRVVAIFHQQATGRASGVPVELHMALLYQLQDGHIVRMENFLDPKQALEAAGLQE